MSIDRTKQLSERAVRKCTPNAERMSNAIKSLIDKVMRGDIFRNASAEGILAYLLCSDELRGFLSSIPPWLYSGQGPGLVATTDGVVSVTPQQAYFYQRLVSVGGTDLLNKLRTLQYGSPSTLDSVGAGSSPLSERIGNQNQSLQDFKTHTDDQSGAGDPITFMRTMGLANSYDTAKQQLEGQNQDNFTQFFNSTIQGPVIIDQMRNLLCNPNSLGQLLARILDLIASSLPFSLDDIAALLGGLSIDDFFNKLDVLFGQLATIFEYLNYLVSLDFSRFRFAQAFMSRYTLGQFLAAAVRGEGRGNCMTRAVLEEFTGNETLRGAISAIDIERQREEGRASASANARTEIGKERTAALPPEKEVFFDPIPEELIAVTGGEGTTGSTGPETPDPSPTLTPPPLDPETLRLIREKLDEVDRRTMILGYELYELRYPASTPEPTG
jgi:hypothetical protein